MHCTLRTQSLAAITLSAALALPAAAQDKDELQKCEKPFGTLAVNEPQQEYMNIFQRYQLGSPAALLRMMAQNSNCFLVLERGVAMQNIQQERQLARGGEMQQDANMGGGQMKAADFVMTAAVQVVNNNAGGVGGVVGGLIGGRGAGLVAGGLKFKEANTSLLLADVRTTVQVAAAEGKARKTNFSLGMLGFSGALVGLGMLGFSGALVGLGGYSNTAEGKVIAASYLDNYNNIVEQLRGNAMMQARAARFDPGALAGDEVRAGASFAEGDVLAPKIDNVKLLASASDAAAAVTTLKKTDDLVFLGEEKDGFVKVVSANGEGWVKKTLVAKK